MDGREDQGVAKRQERTPNIALISAENSDKELRGLPCVATQLDTPKTRERRDGQAC